MVYIAVCEDEQEYQDKISIFIKKYSDINCCDFEVSFFCTVADFWENYQAGSFNIVFLDIYLEDGNGIEIAKKLRNREEECQIVFITSSRDFAIEGFELQARHYITKPIAEEKLVEALNRCLVMLAENMKVIQIPVGKLEVTIRLKDIIYVEVFNKTSVIHTVNGEIKTYLPLSQLENLLGGIPFLRCHRCSIINMNYVEDYTTADFIMKNGDTVGIPRSNSVAVRQQYVDFVFAKVRSEPGA
ncbi:LytTR family DNA-binding domain-containing protein [Acetobacterium sp.]|uniref:LytR/AlgR family response regulator transcription factor n=1 Tax=Acetobacterium sp. TaxID=1872094 RepID=UPI00271BD044|nr:LytTR family DNA-binding domain-containing protein [Acetobacterium sp.]MDO9490645.1 LytTR family DNA-binding domain-containing protein [Acetobacterium sp.]